MNGKEDVVSQWREMWKEGNQVKEEESRKITFNPFTFDFWCCYFCDAHRWWERSFWRKRFVCSFHVFQGKELFNEPDEESSRVNSLSSRKETVKEEREKSYTSTDPTWLWNQIPWPEIVWFERDGRKEGNKIGWIDGLVLPFKFPVTFPFQKVDGDDDHECVDEWCHHPRTVKWESALWLRKFWVAFHLLPKFAQL